MYIYVNFKKKNYAGSKTLPASIKEEYTHCAEVPRASKTPLKMERLSCPRPADTAVKTLNLTNGKDDEWGFGGWLAVNCSRSRP